jgi:hypothetical protein
VPPGGLLLWCTDGLVERRVQDIDIQLDRLRPQVESITDLEPQRCCDLVISELAGPPRTDDIALSCRGWTGPLPPADRGRTTRAAAPRKRLARPVGLKSVSCTDCCPRCS